MESHRSGVRRFAEDRITEADVMDTLSRQTTLNFAPDARVRCAIVQVIRTADGAVRCVHEGCYSEERPALVAASSAG